MKSLAIKYRPNTFDDVVEQDNIKLILQEQIKTNTYKNCYLFTGSAGTGKAQPLNSNILTTRGYVRMGDIKLGQEIIDGNGEITHVIGIYPQGKRDVYRITLRDRTSIEVSDEHINRVFRYNQYKKENEYFDITTLNLIELQNNSKYRLRIPVPTIDIWETHNQVIQPYLLGMLISDGSLSGNFGISNIEKDVLDRVSDQLSDHHYKLKQLNNCDYAMIRDDGKGFNQNSKEVTLPMRIKKYGLNTQSYNKHIPDDYLYACAEDRLELLRGLFDGDGYIDRLGNYQYSTSSSKLSNDFAFLVRSLGIVDTVVEKKASYVKNGNRVTCRNTYTHNLKVPNNLIIIKSNKHLNRRTLKQNDPIRRIEKIEKIGLKECQCIKVSSSDETYITNNMTVTHNTTCARIFANELNKYQGNTIEIDGASNNGVDNIRDIIKESKFKSIDSEFKIYIIDEVHMLSAGAWGALLKLIEEPPKYTIFIFATTDPQKIPNTILSRVQRYDFKKITFNSIVERLKYICDKENEKELSLIYDTDALEYIAKLADGGMRDAITLLDKCTSYSNNINMSNTVKALGTINYDILCDLTDYLLEYKEKEIIELIENVNRNGTDLKQFIKLYSSFVLDICKYNLIGNFEYLQSPSLLEDRFKNYKDELFFKQLLADMIELNNGIKWDSNPKPYIEAVFISICERK